MVVTLIGYRGCGKSSVGRLLAERLGWPYTDADEEIERLSKQTIRQIFAERGELAFRDLEEETIARLLESEELILAAGGGAVLRELTRQRMKSAGPVVWLTASPETLIERIGKDETTAQRRPDLTSQGGLAEIRTLLEQRTPLYRSAADLQIDTEGLSPDEIADNLIDGLSKRQESGL
jgi:shikimate kinase